MCVKEKRYSEIMGAWKLENRNWIFGFHAFLLLMNAFDLGPSFISPEFLISSFKFQAANDYILSISAFNRKTIAENDKLIKI